MAYSNPYYPSGYNDYYNQRLLGKGGSYQPSQQILSLGGQQTPPQEQSQQGGVQGQTSMGSKIGGNVGNGVAIAGAGLDAYNDARNSPDGLVLDKNAGLTGAAKGASAGSAAGPWGTLIGAVVGTVAGQAGTFAKVNKNLGKVDVNPGLTTYDANGKAVYNAGAGLNSVNTLDTIKESQKNINGAADITGTRWIANAIFGTNRKLKRKRDELQKGIRTSQQNFNNADISSVAQQNQIQEYNNRMSGQGRMNNLYSIPKNYQQMF